MELSTVKPAHLHWILELMITNEIPLLWITPKFNRRHTNAVPLIDDTERNYTQLLILALREGLVQLLSGDRVLEIREAVATVIDFKEHPDQESSDKAMLRLTAVGGQMWEHLAEPQWDKFLKFEMTTLSHCLDGLNIFGLLASTNLDLVAGYLGWYECLESVDVKWETLRISIHADYDATYWKRLNGVHEAVFEGVLRKTDRSVPPVVWDWKMLLNNWHTKPWERPDW